MARFVLMILAVLSGLAALALIGVNYMYYAMVDVGTPATNYPLILAAGFAVMICVLSCVGAVSTFTSPPEE